MSRQHAADDFATIRARMEELRREREVADAGLAAPCSGTEESEAERRRRARIEGLPPPWVPTVFIKPPQP